ncbi:MAG: O-acetylhomoserine aminocarboxypropyltransferase/cysteine synthase [Arcobacteraceae bacterium]|jgi:O-acetylhomoserine (thiol)-lyase|nr:O-acetylhomoserine aminocarboxypropyltransferase/cysteine synthase [Arcobacteraceae bacterium]
MQQQTLAVHAGYDNSFGHGSMSAPIEQTTAYAFRDADHAANLFSLQELGPIYTRLNNPTLDILEKRYAALEYGAAAIAVASGQSAIFYAVANLVEAGDNIIISNKLYGGSVTLFTHTMKRFGLSVKVFDCENPSNLQELIDDKTKAIFFESLSNPQIAVSDIEQIVSIAKKNQIITICDNTVATATLFNPLKWGVDVVVHSASKYSDGQGRAIGGIVVERDGLNEFFAQNPRYDHFNTPDESYHGLVYSSLDLPCFCLRIRLSLLRDIGACMSPFNAWLLINGLETLSLRVEKHSSNALEVAKFLDTQKEIVTNVNYPALPTHKANEKVKKYFKNSQASGLLSFDVQSFEMAKKIINSVKLFSIVVNIGDSKSLITHPASTTHSQIPQDELIKSGINPTTIRLSIGLEDPKDLIEDLKQAFAQ